MLERFSATFVICLAVGLVLAALTDIVSFVGATILSLGVAVGSTVGVGLKERRRP